MDPGFQERRHKRNALNDYEQHTIPGLKTILGRISRRLNFRRTVSIININVGSMFDYVAENNSTGRNALKPYRIKINSRPTYDQIRDNPLITITQHWYSELHATSEYDDKRLIHSNRSAAIVN
ncbi:hypothetical protein RF11_07035 [Thelohanellus kitauei]|uniref:Uncharacterized protein n=1 Tax=Thelohanellus kitauei TaxID=669202 RepID=A0A0C2JAH5_THEKT|nr:hypothetical protein RF11_11693 [Thelohanellus kitauei]KII74844.1 hypothetical protein RF11_07035 [Thelohanellus kitauei]